MSTDTGDRSIFATGYNYNYRKVLWNKPIGTDIGETYLSGVPDILPVFIFTILFVPV